MLAWHHPTSAHEGTWNMANFLRSATIVLMGATVMGAGVFVAIYG